MRDKNACYNINNAKLYTPILASPVVEDAVSVVVPVGVAVVVDVVLVLLITARNPKAFGQEVPNVS